MGEKRPTWAKRLEAKLDRLLHGLSWFCTPEDDPYPKELGRAMTTPPATPDRLMHLRPTIYTLGWNAFHEGLKREANPYTSTRGGYRNAWFLGWDDAERGLDRTRTPSADSR
jgi:hypothetical protein